MSKRKDDGENLDEQTPDLVDVNFDYYNVNASNDYHAIQRLFIQLFGPDAQRVQTGALTDLVTTVAEESGVGSTIKTDDDDESDPYAVLTDHPGLQGLIDYVLSKTSADHGFHDALANQQVGLVLSERLVNMPVQVMGPMYKMLSDEIDAAVDEGRGYQFTHYLFLSRVYRLTAEEEEAMLLAQRHAKRHKSAVSTRSDGLYSFHPEDEAILQYATHTTTYTFTDAPKGELDVCGRAMLVPAGEFKRLVSMIEETYRV